MLTFSLFGPIPRYISPKLPPPILLVILYLLFTKLADIFLIDVYCSYGLKYKVDVANINLTFYG